MRKYWYLSILLLFATMLLALVAACGGDDDDNAASKTASPAATTGAATSAASGTAAPTTTPAPTSSGSLGNAGDRKIEVVDMGYAETIDPAFNAFDCGFIVHNVSKTEGADQVSWTANLYDASNNMVGSTYGYIQALLPDETRGSNSCGGQTNPANAVIARMEVKTQVTDYSWHTVTTMKRLTVTVGSVGGSQASGTIHNPYTIEMRNVFVSLVMYNAAGKIVGSSGAHVDSIAAGGDANWQGQAYVDSRSNETLDHVQAYSDPDSLKLSDLANEP
jgi:hypothetical protein